VKQVRLYDLKEGENDDNQDHEDSSSDDEGKSKTQSAKMIMKLQTDQGSLKK
jgi:hypothetical protein